ncbi:MAG TPA: hypothetical protein VJ957_10410 [Longimicrobiales bacterium]|nr:hypothetical protein [Longimicrobiales bacterium]
MTDATRWRFWLALGAVVLLVGCGDPPTPDPRGYTKAPLEEPGLTVKGEQPSPMAALGKPNLPNPPLQAPGSDTLQSKADSAGQKGG